MKIFSIIICILFILCVLEMIRETHSFIVKKYSVHSKKIDKVGIKIAFLTDLHTTSHGKDNRKLIAKVKEETPDMILIGGDMMLAKKNQDFLKIERLLLALMEIAPVYYALGNHEQKLKNKEVYKDCFERFAGKLKNSNVQLLDNQSITFSCKGNNVTLTGLSIPEQFFKKNPRIKFPKVEFDKIMPSLQLEGEETFHILMAHNPSYMETYLQSKADLILAGHFHGGLVRIPYFRGIISTQKQLFPYYSGEMRIKDGQYCVVSRGLGQHTIPIRLFNHAELLILELSGK